MPQRTTCERENRDPVPGTDRRAHKPGGVRLVFIGTLLAVFSVTLGTPVLLLVSAAILLAGFSRIPRRRPRPRSGTMGLDADTQGGAREGPNSHR